MSGTPNIVFDHPVFFAFVYGVAIVQYTCIGRFMLGFIVPATSPNYIWRWFVLLTDWAIRLCRYWTPTYVRGMWMPLVAFFWLTLFRLIGAIALQNMGFAPTLSGAGGG
ncbi:MAG: hypothetical protein ACKOEE_13715 [Tagaea sp.]|nr:hypothetical protein [Azospirillum sp.]MCA3267285.1 hypothetical protein [Azospirillum sp.]MCZ8122029.1 hypothetical protein [Magnetospirillum sp.]